MSFKLSYDGCLDALVFPSSPEPKTMPSGVVSELKLKRLKEASVTETTDFFMAVYLLAVEETMAELQVQPEEVFRFAESPTLRQHMEAYRNDTALVNPKRFAREIMKLRQQLQERQRNTG